MVVGGGGGGGSQRLLCLNPTTVMVVLLLGLWLLLGCDNYRMIKSCIVNIIGIESQITIFAWEAGRTDSEQL